MHYEQIKQYFDEGEEGIIKLLEESKPMFNEIDVCATKFKNNEILTTDELRTIKTRMVGIVANLQPIYSKALSIKKQKEYRYYAEQKEKMGVGFKDGATEKLSKEVLLTITDEIEKKIKNPYHKIFIEDANNIKINSIREITKFVNTAIEGLEYRFVIIDDAHLMNDQAQNALLKNLEEPPEGIIFILLTSNKDKLLPTIQSRCWQINFEPLSAELIKEILILFFSIEKEIADKISNFSEGSVTSALNLLNTDFNILLEKTISFLRFSLGKKYNLAYRELNIILKQSPNGTIKIITRLIKVWLNDVVRNKYSLMKYFFEDYKETLEKFNERFNQTIVLKIFNSIDKLEECEDKNINLNVVCLNLIFEITSISIRK